MVFFLILSKNPDVFYRGYWILDTGNLILDKYLIINIQSQGRLPSIKSSIIFTSSSEPINKGVL